MTLLWIGYIRPMLHDWLRRVEERMNELRITDAEVCRRAGLNRTFLRDLRQRKAIPSVENAEKLASALQWTPQVMLWGDPTNKLNVNVIGHAGGGEVWSLADKARQQDLPIDFFHPDIVWITISTDEFRPRYGIGDIVGGLKVTGPNLHNMIGNDCIIETAEKKRLVRYLMSGSKRGLYALRSFLPSVDDIPDVKLSWAAPIQFVIRRGR